MFLGDKLDWDKRTANDKRVLTLQIPASEASKPLKAQIGASGTQRESVGPGAA